MKAKPTSGRSVSQEKRRPSKLSSSSGLGKTPVKKEIAIDNSKTINSATITGSLVSPIRSPRQINNNSLLLQSALIKNDSLLLNNNNSSIPQRHQLELRSESSADITNHASKELTPLTTLNKDNTQKTLQSKASASTKKQDALELGSGSKSTSTNLRKKVENGMVYNRARNMTPDNDIKRSKRTVSESVGRRSRVEGGQKLDSSLKGGLKSNHLTSSINGMPTLVSPRANGQDISALTPSQSRNKEKTTLSRIGEGQVTGLKTPNAKNPQEKTLSSASSKNISTLLSPSIGENSKLRGKASHSTSSKFEALKNNSKTAKDDYTILTRSIHKKEDLSASAVIGLGTGDTKGLTKGSNLRSKTPVGGGLRNSALITGKSIRIEVKTNEKVKEKEKEKRKPNYNPPPMNNNYKVLPHEVFQ